MTRIKREGVPLVALYIAFGLVTAYMLTALPSATYRDEWGFAEYRIASSILEGGFPPVVPLQGANSFNKVNDIRCSVCSEVAAVGIATATGLPLETVYAHGWWGALLAPLLAYALLRRVATPAWSALGALAATTLTVGFPYYLVDPKGLLLTTHALFLLALWRLLVKPTAGRAALAAGAALLTATVYMPFGIVEAMTLLVVLVMLRSPGAFVAAGSIIGSFAVMAPGCYIPYVRRIVTDLHLPEYPPRYVPHLYSYGVSPQLVVALLFGSILAAALLGRSLGRPSQRLLLAATVCSLFFAVSAFSIHRFFTFVAVPLALVLAEQASEGAAARARRRSRVPDGDGPVLGVRPLEVARPGSVGPLTAVLLDGVARIVAQATDVVNRNRGAICAKRHIVAFRERAPAPFWRGALATLLVIALVSAGSHPGSAVARGGTFTKEYVEGVRWVAENVNEPFTSDVKFVGAVYALTGRTNGNHLLQNYDENGAISAIWYSGTARETRDAMWEHHGSRYIVVTSDMEKIFVVGDFFRKGTPEKLAQLRESEDFRLVFRNADVEVFEALPVARNQDVPLAP